MLRARAALLLDVPLVCFTVVSKYCRVVRLGLWYRHKFCFHASYVYANDTRGPLVSFSNK